MSVESEAEVDVLHNTVLDTIGLEITSGELACGDVLTLDRIQQRFGVSRTVARRPCACWSPWDSSVRVDGSASPCSHDRTGTCSTRGSSGGASRVPDATNNSGRSPKDRRNHGAAAAGAASGRSAEMSNSLPMRTLGEASNSTSSWSTTSPSTRCCCVRAATMPALFRRGGGGGSHQLGLMPDQPVPEALDLHEHERPARWVLTMMPRRPWPSCRRGSDAMFSGAAEVRPFKRPRSPTSVVWFPGGASRCRLADGHDGAAGVAVGSAPADPHGLSTVLTAVVRRPFVSAPGADSGTDHGGMHYVATSRTHFARITRMSEETVKSTDRLREPEVRDA